MESPSRQIDLLQTVIDSLIGQYYSDNECPKLYVRRDQSNITDCFIHLSSAVIFDINQIAAMKDQRLCLPIVRDRLLEAYRNMHDLIEDVINHLEDKK